MSRRKKRGWKRSAAVRSPGSAALVSQEAGVPAEGGGAVSRPAWAPGDVDLFKVPEPVRRAVAEIVEPAYRKLVAEVEDPLERSVGLTLVHLMWLEVLDQHETKHEYLQTAVLELPEDRSGMIDRHLRMLNTKVKVGSFLMRLREMRRERNESCHPKTEAGGWELGVGGEKVSGTAARLGGETEANVEDVKAATQNLEAGSLELEAGGREVTVGRDHVAVTGRPPEGGTTNPVSAVPAARLGGETEANVEDVRAATQKTEAGSWKMGVGMEKVSAACSRGGKPTAEEMKAATQKREAGSWELEVGGAEQSAAARDVRLRVRAPLR